MDRLGDLGGAGHLGLQLELVIIFLNEVPQGHLTHLSYFLKINRRNY